ncbi:hypothetical protein AGMMS50229_01330 [Campylobacterota bacterium]|nr:hypothetical protein AGMMS50229_01330 [Campylobacterota bacterium]
MDETISEAEQQRYDELLAIALDFARHGETDELAKMLAAKLPIDLCDHRGNSLLMLAAYNGHEQTAAMLLAAGADPNLANAHSQTPLEGVAFKGYEAIARLLVDHGTSEKSIEKSLAFASIFGRGAIAEYLAAQRGKRSRFWIALSKITGVFRWRSGRKKRKVMKTELD